MSRKPLGERPMTPAERQRRRRQRLGLDGPTIRFAKAVQLALGHGLPHEKLHELVDTGMVRFREKGPVTETKLARKIINPPSTQAERQRAAVLRVRAKRDTRPVTNEPEREMSANGTKAPTRAIRDTGMVTRQGRA